MRIDADSHDVRVSTDGTQREVLNCQERISDRRKRPTDFSTTTTTTTAATTTTTTTTTTNKHGKLHKAVQHDSVLSGECQRRKRVDPEPSVLPDVQPDVSEPVSPLVLSHLLCCLLEGQSKRWKTGVSTLRVSSFIHSFNVIILNGSELFLI